jgi:hypothetical protein
MSEMKTLIINGQVRTDLSSHVSAGPRIGLGRPLNRSVVARPAAIALARELDRLHELVVALPLSALDACFARNWLRSAKHLLSSGELGAAGFQVAAVSRKLAGRHPRS